MTKTVTDQFHYRRHHYQQHAAGKNTKTLADAACAAIVVPEMLP